MECRKWEETGLLYSAQEMNGKETDDYEEHLKECEDCRSELYRYRQEHRRFFTAENLQAVPSRKVDAEILRVCFAPGKCISVATPVLFSSFFRKAFVAVALLMIGFVPVTYIALNVRNAEQTRSASVRETKTVAGATQMATTVETPSAAGQAAADSLKDSLDGNKVNYAKTRGNLSGQGAIPVDLKNK